MHFISFFFRRSCCFLLHALVLSITLKDIHSPILSVLLRFLLLLLFHLIPFRSLFVFLLFAVMVVVMVLLPLFFSLHSLCSQCHRIGCQSSYSFCLYFIRKFHNSYDLTGDEVKLSWLCFAYTIRSVSFGVHPDVHTLVTLMLVLRSKKALNEWKSISFYPIQMTKNV